MFVVSGQIDTDSCSDFHVLLIENRRTIFDLGLSLDTAMMHGKNSLRTSFSL